MTKNLARFIAKGGPADVAAQAAVHGLYLVGGYDHLPESNELVGYLYANRAEFLHQRLQTWLGAEPIQAPYPPGALLWFRVED